MLMVKPSLHAEEEVMPQQFVNLKEVIPDIKIDLRYSKEWWHFTYKDEPFPDTYFDFPIE
jgi:D-alanyl-D-alanine dipeptidase